VDDDVATLHPPIRAGVARCGTKSGAWKPQIATSRGSSPLRRRG
jgi:hypothetical protein